MGAEGHTPDSKRKHIKKRFMTKPQLTVYKASAGSGKTFTLAKEYMTLVIANPLSYKTILAVTFTNKATEEMKTRILSQLYGIAHRLADSQEYARQIHQALPHLSEAQIAANAATALTLLLHNYNYFRVETIDKFFQSVLRNLARELDLTANLRIGLNDRQVEEQAVDELIEQLDNTNKLLFWIMEYIRENIANDKSWNVIGQIKEFGRHIFKDYYKESAGELEACFAQEGFFKSYTQKLRRLQTEAEDTIQEIAATFFDALEENGLSADSLAKKTTGIWSYFNKLRNGRIQDEDLLNATFQKCSEKPEAWVKKADAKAGNPVFDLVVSTLHPLLLFSEQRRPQLAKTITSVKLTMRHLYQLRLLGSIEGKVREINQGACRFLLSDTQTLLHSLIQDSDSPFIFEKIGTQLEHIMIDEFQDTSTIQWKNFKVLLEETMSREDAHNLIVGDVKQSIYRWRSGDWRLLNNIEREFGKGGAKLIDVRSLDTNYRSDRNIINFNNAFFATATEKEREMLGEADPEQTQQLANAYADVAQKVPEKRTAKGGVSITLLASDDDCQQRTLEATLETIRSLRAEGVGFGQMAILVRQKKHIEEIAEYLMDNEPEYPLVSDEAFRLDASQAVNTIVTAMHYLAHPADCIAQATLRKAEEQLLEAPGATGQLEAQREELLSLPLFELTERLYELYRLGETEAMRQQSAYVCAFYDQLSAYLQDNSSDIESFLAEWGESIHEKSIQSDSTDGIRLITIHKSKGLEFDNVIVPFCDWKLEQTDNIWCRPSEEPYCELPLVPVTYSAKQLKGSIYAADYHHEHLQNVVDNLNLLYVAFTRAGKNLFVVAKRSDDRYRGHIIEKCLEEVAQKLGEGTVPVSLEGIDTPQKDADIIFQYGETDTEAAALKPQEESQNILARPSQPLGFDIKTTSTLPDFRQSNKSRDFIKGDEQEEQQKHYIKLGTVLHNIFSTIRTQQDIATALREMEEGGVLYDENVSRKRIEEMLRKRLATPQVKDWFSDRWTVFNECSILSVENGKSVEHRPDRVMKNDKEIIVVDFKFAKPKDEHTEQVAQYMSLLTQMHPGLQVRGYLWYVYPNNIVEVKL